MNDDDYYSDLMRDFESPEARKQRYEMERAVRESQQRAYTAGRSSSPPKVPQKPAVPARTMHDLKRLTADEVKLLPDDLRVAMLRHRLRLTGYKEKELMQQLEECCNGFYYLRHNDGVTLIWFETEADLTKFKLQLKL